MMKKHKMNQAPFHKAHALKGCILVCLAMFFTVFSHTCTGQDIQFSQFYSASLYLNPAFAGSNHMNRYMFHQRLQWPGLDAKYITSMVSFDTFWKKYSSGFGIYAYKDWQGSSDITSTEIDFLYSYELPVSKTFTVRAGLQLALVDRKLSYSGLVFPDQLNNNGNTGSTSFDHKTGERILYPDVSSGILVYSNEAWFSFSTHHMNRANQSFISDVSRLPVKYTFAGGYKFVVGKSPRIRSTIPQEFVEKCITPVVHYKFQGKSDQIDIGLYADYERAVGGMWYRGIPYLKKYRKDLQNNESVVFLFGWKFDLVYIAYSYDVTVSRLSRVRSGGSHEIHIRYHHSKKSPRKKYMKRLPCPDF